MDTERASEHFTWHELLRSDAGAAAGLQNVPSHVELAALAALAETVLEPLRLALGPIRINSGFRSPEVNRLVGGEPESQHLKGEAADCVPTSSSLDAGMRFLASGDLPFDQAILEPTWIHVSFTRRHAPRRQMLRAVRTAGHRSYVPWEG